MKPKTPYYMVFIILMIIANIAVFIIFSNRLKKYTTVVVSTDSLIDSH